MPLISGLDVPRNRLYRERRVLIELQTGLVLPGITTTLRITGGKVSTVPVREKVKFELTEVSTVMISSSGATALSNGVVASVMQPWYFQPFIIEITGRSYMGAFAQRNLNVGADDDVRLISRMRELINQSFFMARTSVRNLKATITIGDPKKNSGGTDQQFVGFFDDVSVEESQDNPYIQVYRLRFTAELAFLANQNRGSEGSQVDRAVAPTIKTSSVSTTKAPKPPPPTRVDVPPPPVAPTIGRGGESSTVFGG